INMAIAQGGEIQSVPGPSAVTAALVVSGLPTDKFAFQGFLPNKKAARVKKLKLLSAESRTLIFFESCHRIQKTLEDIREVFGDIYVVCVRELTKKFEEVKRGAVGEIGDYFSVNKPRGEFVILFNLKMQNTCHREPNFSEAWQSESQILS
ncbi:MAG: SAM-dependent methyltransferase, partial [Candidatus Omnitrophota bacterium]